MTVLRLDDLHPDGIRIVVDWSRFTPGSSIFVPCLDLDACIQQVERIAERKKWKIQHRVWAENNILGLRVWRIA
jgi:hypothetical protein